MRFLYVILAATQLLFIEVRSDSEIYPVDAADREPLTMKEQLLNLHLRLDKMFSNISEDISQVTTELHTLRLLVGNLTSMAERAETIVQNVENDNDLLMRNITIISQQSVYTMRNQQYCANHDALEDLFLERCGELPPNFPPATTTGPSTIDTTTPQSTTTPASPVSQYCASAPSESGVYRFTRPDGIEFHAYCEQELHGGHWMVFQSRQDGSVDFNRSWSDYRNGFGEANGEYWLGLENLHQLTADTAPEMLIVMENFDEHSEYAMYKHFWVDSESTHYILKMNSTNAMIAGNTGDSLYLYHSMAFVTYDHSSGSYWASCAQTLGSGFWHYDCDNLVFRERNNLNGIYGRENGRRGIWWGYFGNTGTQNNAPLKTARMMIRI